MCVCALFTGINVSDLPNLSSLPTIPTRDQLISILFEAYDAIPTRETVRVEAGKVLETAKLVLHEHMSGFEGPFPFPMVNIQMPDLKLSSFLNMSKENSATAGDGTETDTLDDDDNDNNNDSKGSQGHQVAISSLISMLHLRPE